MAEFYDWQGNPMDIREWGAMRESNNDQRRVDRTVVVNEAGDSAEVSTVWIGIDLGWRGGPPLIFETMVFGGPHDNHTERYATVDEARAGHARITANLLAGLDPEVVALPGAFND